MNCIIHPNEPASPDCEGWAIDLCDRCLCGLGYPSMQPSWGALYAIGTTILQAEERRCSRLVHPEVLTYESHASGDLAMCARG